MADPGRTDDGTDDRASLEMPSFALRRRRRAPEQDATTNPPPALSGLPGAAVSGLVVGGLAVLLAWLATTGCSAVRGTSSCGGGPGLLILVGVLVLLAYAGSWLLSRFGVPEAGSTSALAVGVMAVLVMVFLLESTDEWWMVIAIPVVTVIAFGLSWWVTTAATDAEPTDEPPAPHDVR